MRNLYCSDLHLLHANIIRFCRRPFRDADHMTQVIVANLRAAEATGARIIHGGDASFALGRVIEKYGPIFQHPERHVHVGGNHDRHIKDPKPYEQTFGTIVGTERTWKTNVFICEDYTAGGLRRQILVSHDPQGDLQGCDYNVYGHHHNNLTDPKSRAFIDEKEGAGYCDRLLASPVHLNASVELHAYQPVSLSELIAVNAEQRNMHITQEV